MFKTRVKFKLIGSSEIHIGYLVKDNWYKNRHKVITADKTSSYCISLLEMIERI